MNTCPRCGVSITRWEPRSGNREAGFCNCNPLGPVLTRPIVTKPAPKRGQSEEAET